MGGMVPTDGLSKECPERSQVRGAGFLEREDHVAARRRGDRMKRREFLSLLGGAAAWPFSVSAQQSGGMRRIGVLLNVAADDPESLTRITAFAQGLQELGWSDGRNVRIDYRWGGANVERTRRYAAELVAL